MKAPFPWFGGKSKVAHIVWRRFGNVANYVEPFYGSGAVHLLRPANHKNDGAWPTETINDKDGFVSNFWRAIKYAPQDVAGYADWPINENDLHARHIWLVKQMEDLRERLEGDPDYYDPRIAGYWVWGICAWIGTGFCSGVGPWQSVNGRLVNTNGNAGRGINRQIPHLGNAGQGINRQIPHLGDAGRGINRQIPHLGDAGQGINRQIPHLGDAGQGILEYFNLLSERLRRVRVASGDWRRVCGQSVTDRHGLTGVFLDPPYEDYEGEVYNHNNNGLISAVRAWSIENGDNKNMRIALCGYDGEHGELVDRGWSVWEWSANGGYAKNGNRHRERIWFSPHCLGDMSGLPLFDSGKTVTN